MRLHSSLALTGLLGLVALGCSSGGSGQQEPDLELRRDMAMVAGSVTFRERMALPPDAVVEVTLVDVSRMDAAARVVAETTVVTSGRQVPLPFELRYDDSRIDPSRSYAVRATIRSGGQMQFTTDQVHPVITQGNPTRVDLTLVRVSTGTVEPTAPLQGTAWVLVELGGRPVLDEIQATLEFPPSGRVGGSGSCNRFFGSVRVTGDSIAISQMGVTQMACPDPIATQEADYLKALEAAERFEIDGANLLIYSRDMERPLRFRAR
jgi:putative lipoprotein